MMRTLSLAMIFIHGNPIRTILVPDALVRRIMNSSNDNGFTEMVIHLSYRRIPNRQQPWNGELFACHLPTNARISLDLMSEGLKVVPMKQDCEQNKKANCHTATVQTGVMQPIKN
jgi:hypothetical protein